MASRQSTGKNTSGPNQPPSHEVKDLVFDKPLDFPTFNFSERYSPHIPSQSTHDPTYTSSPETPNPNKDSTSNKDLCGVTAEEPLYRIPNNEIDQLHRHTQAYLKSIGKIPIICQIPRSRATHRTTQPFGEDDTLTSSIDDLIIDTISEIRQSIATIAHSKIEEDTKFHNLPYFPKGYSTFYTFPEAQAGGFGPPDPPETNPPCTNTPSPKLNFNFIANMEANRPWLAANAIVVPGAQHTLPKHLEKLLPKFYPDSDVSPKDHIKQFMLSLRLMDVQHKDVVCRLFLYSFINK